MDNDRLKHSYSVAKKMMEIGKNMGLSEEEIKELFLLGFVHDIGYELGNGNEHNINGGLLLSLVDINTGWKFIIMGEYKVNMNLCFLIY